MTGKEANGNTTKAGKVSSTILVDKPWTVGTEKAKQPTSVITPSELKIDKEGNVTIIFDRPVCIFNDTALTVYDTVQQKNATLDDVKNAFNNAVAAQKDKEAADKVIGEWNKKDAAELKAVMANTEANKADRDKLIAVGVDFSKYDNASEVEKYTACQSLAKNIATVDALKNTLNAIFGKTTQDICSSARRLNEAMRWHR